MRKVFIDVELIEVQGVANIPQSIRKAVEYSSQNGIVAEVGSTFKKRNTTAYVTTILLYEYSENSVDLEKTNLFRK